MHRRTDTLLLIAIYEFVTGALLLLISCVVLPLLLVVTPFVADGFGNFLLRFFWVSLALLAAFGFGVASIVVGVGVLARREWARVGAMALAVPALLGFPIWTVAGILIIWYLAGDDGRRPFASADRSWSERFFGPTGSSTSASRRDAHLGIVAGPLSDLGTSPSHPSPTAEMTRLDVPPVRPEEPVNPAAESIEPDTPPNAGAPPPGSLANQAVESPADTPGESDKPRPS